MATSPMQDQQTQGGIPPNVGGAASSPDQGSGGNAQPTPTSAPANPLQMTLARWYQVAKDMARSDPRLASGASKVADGIQEMQTALISPPQTVSPNQQPQY